MGKHTPGPWETGDPARGDSDLMVYCNDATGSRIADCTNNLVFHPRDEKRANARLIAASPEMLDCLELTYLALLQIDGPTRLYLDRTLARLRDTIATATGLEGREVQERCEEQALLSRMEGRK